MSNFIPPAAVSAATSAALRPANEAALARKAQQLKNDLRTQDVADVDESGPDAVGDDHQQGGNKKQQQHSRPSPEDKVDIASLDPAPFPLPPDPGAATPPHLDISA